MNLRSGRIPFLSFVLLLCLSWATVALADGPAERYGLIKVSADGIGKIYMGREISQVMGWQGAAWLERAEREQEERGSLLLPELGLKFGMRVADVGAGTGYYSRRMAPLVGPTGKAYAVEIQPEMVRMLDAASKNVGLGNVEPVLGAVDNVKLADAAIDVALMVDVYHELEFPHEMLTSNQYRACAQDGRTRGIRRVPRRGCASPH